jgi:hypothetical protein
MAELAADVQSGGGGWRLGKGLGAGADPRTSGELQGVGNEVGGPGACRAAQVAQARARCHGTQGRLEGREKHSENSTKKTGKSSKESPGGRLRAWGSQRRIGAGGFRRNRHRNTAARGGR